MIIFNLPPALNQLIYALLSIQDLSDIRIRNRLMCIHAVADDLINIRKADLPVQELADSPLVCRIEHSRHGASDACRIKCILQTEEGLRIRIFKGDLPKLCKIQAFPAQISPFR